MLTFSKSVCEPKRTVNLFVVIIMFLLYYKNMIKTVIFDLDGTLRFPQALKILKNVSRFLKNIMRKICIITLLAIIVSK